MHKDTLKLKGIQNHWGKNDFRKRQRLEETPNKLIQFMVRRPKEVPVVQAHHERNQPLAIRPEPFDYAQENPIEGPVQRLLSLLRR
jgi:hypothetical protein